jgi:hypothetical protein
MQFDYVYPGSALEVTQTPPDCTFERTWGWLRVHNTVANGRLGLKYFTAHVPIVLSMDRPCVLESVAIRFEQDEVPGSVAHLREFAVVTQPDVGNIIPVIAQYGLRLNNSPIEFDQPTADVLSGFIVVQMQWKLEAVGHMNIHAIHVKIASRPGVIEESTSK